MAPPQKLVVAPGPQYGMCIMKSITDCMGRIANTKKITKMATI